MEITGKILKIIDKSGTSKAGKDYTSYDLVIVSKETDYWKEGMVVTFYGKNADLAKKAKVGDEVTASINSKISEYNDKYYTNISGWKLEVLSSDSSSDEDEDEDLPW